MELTPIAAWLNSACAGFDAAVTEAIYGLYTLCEGFFSPFFNFVTYWGKDGLPFIFVLGVLLMLFKRTRRLGLTMMLAIGVGALITNLALKPLVARPRPYLDEGSIFYQMWSVTGQHTESDLSFPSGHTTATFAYCTAIFLCCKKSRSWPALVFGLLMGLSRIYLGVHYPSDVLGGILCGACGAVIAYYLTALIPGKFYDHQLRFMARKQHDTIGE